MSEPHCNNEDCLKNESWKDIQEYENKYQISNLGRVKSLNYHRMNIEKILTPKINRYGYLTVNLSKNGKIKIFLVHRLVAQAFIPNPLNLPQVNHKKEFEKQNNKAENLEWCTNKYNMNYGTGRERRLKNTDFRKRAEKLMIKVYQYDFKGDLVKEWKSTSDAGRNGFDITSINECCNQRKSKTHRGYVWSYKEMTREEVLTKSEFKYRKIIQKTLDDKIVKIWNSIKEITEQLGINKACISSCCYGKLKTSGGYKWEYKIIKNNIC